MPANLQPLARKENRKEKTARFFSFCFCPQRQRLDGQLGALRTVNSWTDGLSARARGEGAIFRRRRGCGLGGWAGRARMAAAAAAGARPWLLHARLPARARVAGRRGARGAAQRVRASVLSGRQRRRAGGARGATGALGVQFACTGAPWQQAAWRALCRARAARRAAHGPPLGSARQCVLLHGLVEPLARALIFVPPAALMPSRWHPAGDSVWLTGPGRHGGPRAAAEDEPLGEVAGHSDGQVCQAAAGRAQWRAGPQERRRHAGCAPEAPRYARTEEREREREREREGGGSLRK